MDYHYASIPLVGDAVDKGYVYVLTNPDMPHVVKVGKTTQLPEFRACELKTTGVPSDFVVEFYIKCDCMSSLENLVHERLPNRREGREFFEVPLEQAIIKTLEVAKHLGVKKFKTFLRNPALIPYDPDLYPEPKAQAIICDHEWELTRFGGRSCKKCGRNYHYEDSAQAPVVPSVIGETTPIGCRHQWEASRHGQLLCNLCGLNHDSIASKGREARANDGIDMRNISDNPVSPNPETYNPLFQYKDIADLADRVDRIIPRVFGDYDGNDKIESLAQ